MVATAFADQLEASGTGYRKRPIDNHGKKRIISFFYQNRTGGVLPDGTEIDLGFLPYGVTRILIPECFFRAPVAAGASRLLDVGRRAYSSKFNPSPSALEAEELDQIVNGANIAGVVARTNFDTVNDLFIDYSARNAIGICARVRGGTIPAGWQLEGYITYVNE